ncbi:MAG: ABC transporter permease [Myxococcota bacterium]
MSGPRSFRAIGRLRTLMWREFTELARDPFTLLILTIFPLLMIAMLSYALTTEVRNLPLGVFDADQSEPSRGLLSAIESTGYFRMVPLESLARLRSEMASTGLAAALIIPPGFSSDLARGRVTRIQALFDGTETVISANADGIIAATVHAFEQKLHARNPRVVPIAGGVPPPFGLAPGEIDQEGGNVEALPRRGDVARPAGAGSDLARARGVGAVRVVQRNLFNPGMRATDFTLPGLIGFITTFLCILTTALAIVRERQAGTFEQLRVTPVTTIEIIIGKIVPLGLVYLADTLLLMLIGVTVFDVWPRGSILLLLTVTSLYLLLNLSIGLLISSAAPTPDQAVQMTVLVVVPQLSLSGLVFPIHSMPDWARALVEVIPLAHYLRIIRGIYLSGSGIVDIWLELAVLLVFLAFFMARVSRSLSKLKV